jgi:hypothetical protein
MPSCGCSTAAGFVDAVFDGVLDSLKFLEEMELPAAWV